MDRKNGVEALEVGLLLEAIFHQCGSDFRQHNRDLIRHKLRAFTAAHSIATLSALQEKILHDPAFVEPVLCALDERRVPLFENPEQWLKVRKNLIPWLRSCPAPTIWIADCVSAEDIFGLIIVLIEERLYHKTRCYVTGPNAHLLSTAREGRFSSHLFKLYEANYYQAGGLHSLAAYCTRIDDRYVFNTELHCNITWAQYNLGTDASLNEFDSILCCGGLEAFTVHLRHRAIKIFYESQPVFGVLTLMGKAPLDTAPFVARYKALSERYGVYQRMPD